MSAPSDMLECPECGAEVIPSRHVGCLECGAEGDVHVYADCTGEIVPTWTEDDEGMCPECGTELRVVVEDGRAWCREASS